MRVLTKHGFSCDHIRTVAVLIRMGTFSATIDDR